MRRDGPLDQVEAFIRLQRELEKLVEARIQTRGVYVWRAMFTAAITAVVVIRIITIFKWF